MKRYIEGEERSQATLFPEQLDNYIPEDNPVGLFTFSLMSLICSR